MKIRNNYYLVRNGEAFEIDHDNLNRYPYIVDDEAHDAEEQYSDDWHLYETSSSEWCIAYAADRAAAIALADQYDRGEIEHGNVWCEICGHAHGALSAQPVTTGERRTRCVQ